MHVIHMKVSIWLDYLRMCLWELIENYFNYLLGIRLGPVKVELELLKYIYLKFVCLFLTSKDALELSNINLYI